MDIEAPASSSVNRGGSSLDRTDNPPCFGSESP